VFVLVLSKIRHLRIEPRLFNWQNLTKKLLIKRKEMYIGNVSVKKVRTLHSCNKQAQSNLIQCPTV
jgi:hypothetical protein